MVSDNNEVSNKRSSNTERVPLRDRVSREDLIRHSNASRGPLYIPPEQLKPGYVAYWARVEKSGRYDELTSHNIGYEKVMVKNPVTGKLQEKRVGEGSQQMIALQIPKDDRKYLQEIQEYRNKQASKGLPEFTIDDSKISQELIKEEIEVGNN